MPRCLPGPKTFAAILGVGLLLPFAGASGQQRTIRVVGDDGEPVAYANVTVAGERPRITNEKGEVDIGSSRRAEFIADVRRLGYEPYYGKLTMADTAMSAQITLHRLSRRLFTVKITDSSRTVPSFLHGFYERMLARQRGVGTGVYLTPEEIEKRSASMPTALLQGLNGVSLSHTATGKIVAMNSGNSCQMAVLIDGHRVCPENGCNATPPAPADPGAGAPRRGRTVTVAPQPKDETYVLVDNLVSVTEVAAVEVYPRGATVPMSLPSVDTSCGLVAFWTGGRRAP